MMESTEKTAARRSFIVIINLIGWMVLLSAAGLGIIHFHECPVQPNLPVYLTVMGASGLLAVLLGYVQNTMDEGFLVRVCRVFSLMLYVFIICWFFAGTYWIYSVYGPSYDVTTEYHCHKTLYLFAFWFNNLCFLCMFIVFIFCVYTIVYSCAVALFHR